MPIGNSVFDVRRAKVRFGDDAYESLRKRLRAISGNCERTLDDIGSRLCIRWSIVETVLHDEDAECVPDDYPVLLVEAQLILWDKLWVVKRCPYTLVIAENAVFLRDDFSNCFDFDYQSGVEWVIARTLKQ